MQSGSASLLKSATFALTTVLQTKNLPNVDMDYSLLLCFKWMNGLLFLNLHTLNNSALRVQLKNPIMFNLIVLPGYFSTKK